MDELELMANGKTAFVSGYGEDTWHRLGQTCKKGIPADQVLKEAYMAGWQVEKFPTFTELPVIKTRKEQVPEITDDGVTMVEKEVAYTEMEKVTIQGKSVITRINPITSQREILGEGDVNGVVGKSFDPFQNESLVTFLQGLADSHEVVFDTAGSLRGGTDVFVTMKAPEDMLIGGVDAHRLNIAILNGHIGNRAITALVTPTRIVCANTQRAALKNAQAIYKIKHTKNAPIKVEEVRVALDISFNYMAEFQKEAEKMMNEALAMDEFRKVCSQIWSDEFEKLDDIKSRGLTLARAKFGKLEDLFAVAETQAPIRGTRWAGYNAITEYLDHFSPVRAGDGDPSVVRALRSIDGDSVKQKEMAFKLLSVG